jgi:hypothetical protein
MFLRTDVLYFLIRQRNISNRALKLIRDKNNLIAISAVFCDLIMGLVLAIGRSVNSC